MELFDGVLVPLFGALEERGFQVMRASRTCPVARPTCWTAWLQQLHTYGLLSGAFRPDAEIRRLRSYLRQRAMLVEYRPTMSSTCRKR